MTNDPYHQQVLEEIRCWEARGPSFLNRLSDSILVPAQKAAEALIPGGLLSEVSGTLEQAMNSLHGISNSLVNYDRLNAHVDVLTQELGSELAASDALARRCWGWNVAYAGAEGAITGIGGWAGFMIDVPALYALSLRALIEIGTCFGFDMSAPEERQYIHDLMSLGSSGEANGKLGLILEVKKLEQGLLVEASTRLGLGLAGTRRAAEAIGAGMIRRKSFQMLPVLGGIFGATLNAAYVHDLAETAFMCFRRRRVAELLLPPVEHP